METEQIIVKDNILNQYPCQAYLGGKWVEAIALRELRLRTGDQIGFDLIYLIEFTLIDSRDPQHKQKQRNWLGSEQVQLGKPDIETT